MAILFVYREQKEQLQKMKDYGSEPQMPDHLPPQDSRLQNTPSRPGLYPVWENNILRKMKWFLLCMFVCRLSCCCCCFIISIIFLCKK